MFVIDITKPLNTTVAVVPHDTNTNTVSCLAQWHPMLQKFIPVAQGTEELNLETATQLYDNVKADTFALRNQQDKALHGRAHKICSQFVDVLFGVAN